VKLSQLVKTLGLPRPAAGKDLNISGLCEDSRSVKLGDLFFCLSGAKQDGRDFARQAVERGALGLVVEKEAIPDLGVPQLVVKDGRIALALAARAFYRNPSRRVKVIGVTGTKGKTTTTFLIRHLLEKMGCPTGLIGTISYQVGNKTYDAPNTTPSALTVQRLLSEMEKAGCSHAVMEVSSHSLVQNRVLGVEFQGAAFTNLGRDHLDFHKNFSNYFKAKSILFKHFPSVRARAVNADDPWGRKLLKTLGRKGVGFGIKTPCRYQASQVRLSPGRSSFVLQGMEFEVPLTGLFNVYNSLTALSVLAELGFSLKTLGAALRLAPAVPGRFEKVSGGQDFTVLVDYAHTSDALEQALRASRDTLRQTTGGRLLSVFGCGGDRDRTKRPLMGKISSELADLTVVTSDNPRTEKPKAILKEILSGIPEKSRKGVFVREDRRSAIRLALSRARKGDLVLIAGKGHETYQIFGTQKVHFDDREEARKALKELKKT
jgi:UDP-N-acetylmuramoyl-L-alanyl-D-glutamate--2,6-diaminopimelate ligase